MSGTPPSKYARPPVAESVEVKRKVSQSLFLVDYLGKKLVSESCSDVTIPWVIEELRLKKRGESQCWFTPGLDHFALVKETGEQQLECPHADIVRCCAGSGDGRSFAVVVRMEEAVRRRKAGGNVQCICHVFETANAQDATCLVQKLRAHTSIARTPESAKKFRQQLSSSPLSKSPSADEGLNRSGTPSFSSNQLSESMPSQTPLSPLLTLHSVGSDPHVKEFTLQYGGSVRVPSPNVASIHMDDLLVKLRQAQQTAQESRGGGGGEGESVGGDSEGKGGGGGGREETDVGTRATPPASAVARLLVNKSYSSMDALADIGGSEKLTGGKSVLNLLKDDNESGDDLAASGQLAKEGQGDEGQGGEGEGQEGQKEGQRGEEGQLGEEEQGGEEREDSLVTSQKEELLGTPPSKSEVEAAPLLSQTLPSISVTPNSPTGNGVPAALSLTQQHEPDEPVFSVMPSSMSGDELSSPGIYYQTVLLTINTRRVCVTSQACGKVVLEKLITSIACCIQGRNQSDHLGFVTKEMQGERSARLCYCHVFKAESQAKSYSVLKTFQTTFLRALKKTLPDSLCSSCPLLQLHFLCKDLEGQDKTEAQQQARVQEALSTLTDKDYNSLMKQFKSQSIGSSDREELVELVALYRQHLETQQANHTHTANDDESAGLGETKFGEKGKIRSLSRLERARQSLASSLGSLRSKVQKKGTKTPPDGRGLQRQQALSPTATPLSAKLSSDSMDTQPSPSVGTTPGRDRSSSMPVNNISARFSWQHEEERRMTTGSGPPRPIDVNGSVKSVGLPSFDGLESSTGQILRHNGLGSLSSSMQSSSTVNSSFSEPTSPVARTSPKPKHRRQLSLSPPSTTGKKSSISSLSAYISPVKQRSWRQMAFESVTPQRGMGRDTSIPELTAISKAEPSTLPLEKVGEFDSPKTRARKRWRMLVEQQIMLNRIERLNSNYLLEAQQAELKRKKLSYFDPTIVVMEAQSRWDQLMSTEQVTDEELKMSLFRGVSPHKRGDVWAFLVKQKLSSLQQQQEEEEGETDSDGPTLPEYQDVKDGVTEYQQVITMDLGRTFPSHPYFTETFQDGQRELYNVLHAYSVADPEVGYCQGMSYVAGIFLIHSREERQAFKLLWHYMHEYGFRDHYKHNMFVLQVRMYQLSAQLHEYLPVLHDHLEKHTVSTYLIAASWFLTMFSSQYPFAFVSRVMDLVLFEGLEAFFKVSLALLTLHEDSLLQCDSMESISEYIKVDIPDTALDHLPYIMSYALKAPPDFSLKLKGFETEYYVLHNLKLSTSPQKEPRSLEETVEEVKKQNGELIEQVAACRGAITRLEAQVKSLQEKDARKDKVIEMLTQRLDALEQKGLDPPNLQLV